ncbi:P-loop containing nucleoside triphosphate hydrolase protein [Aspergillus foveolatus]|uniref:P-loop containing nucleoside triphosphate hydrolase protein n=1 Tax=Aspergillus foveolatus TaxID=210207 RepID=UPI003CCD79D5
MSASTSFETPSTAFSHLRTSTSSYRLSQIEKVRANGVGEVVALPQLAVCGDQSAGKSSVLEGITGIPFPRQDGLCTRFPTEIILRHNGTTQTQTITASIRPHTSRPKVEQKLLASYSRTLKDILELPSIIAEVSKLMGIRGYTDDDDYRPSFAPDALRIEITGPIGLQLSVVDLPGLISVASEEQTEDDILTVRNMVATYLQSFRTIILAVVQATNDFANQEIIKLARRYDPDGQRTVGIITKPDLINKGTEAKIARIAKNQDTIKLKLGYFLLKNPSPAELDECTTMAARSALELRFLTDSVWASQHLDMDRVGADKLRHFLQRLLDAHIERELPKVRAEIKKRFAETEAELKSMEGNYHSSKHNIFTRNGNARLRALIQEANTSFATQMHERGKRRVVRDEGDNEDDDKNNDQHSVENDTDGVNNLIDDEIGAPLLYVNNEQMMDWVRQVHSRTRGKELPGNYNSTLLAELFHEQSRRWFNIAQSHVRHVRHIASQWKDQVLHAIISEEKLRTERLAMEELDKLIQDEQRDPLTYNHYYTDNIQKARLNAQREEVRNAVTRVANEDWNGNLHISNTSYDLDTFLRGLGQRITIDMDKQACDEALTQLNAYYKVALKTFIDNMARQVIERHLISPLPKAFCPTSVAQLDDEALLRIGSEPAHETARWTRLTSMANGLRQSLLELQRSVS